MTNNSSCRLALIPAHDIKRMPGVQIGASRKGVGKVRNFAKKRGHCKPVILSDSDGRMTIIAGAAAFEACLEEKGASVPAVIVQTDGEADSLMFALQAAELNEAPDAVAVSGAVVRLIDVHGVPRKHIAETLGKSPAWVSGMEKLSRGLNGAVQKMVAGGQIPSRTAQEIARLPYDVQTPFAVSAANELLCKGDVTYLVNRFLNEGVGADERDRIIHAPRLALPNEWKPRAKVGRDNSVSGRLSRAIARCMGDATWLFNLLGGVDVGGASISVSDVISLAESLAALRIRLLAVFYPGENTNGDGGGAGD